MVAFLGLLMPDVGTQTTSRNAQTAVLSYARGHCAPSRRAIALRCCSLVAISMEAIAIPIGGLQLVAPDLARHVVLRDPHLLVPLALSLIAVSALILSILVTIASSSTRRKGANSGIRWHRHLICHVLGAFTIFLLAGLMAELYIELH